MLQKRFCGLVGLFGRLTWTKELLPVAFAKLQVSASQACKDLLTLLVPIIFVFVSMCLQEPLVVAGSETKQQILLADLAIFRLFQLAQSCGLT